MALCYCAIFAIFTLLSSVEHLHQTCMQFTLCIVSEDRGLDQTLEKRSKTHNMDISYSHDRACEGYRFTNRELPMPIGGFNLFHVVESSYAQHWAFASRFHLGGN